MPSAQISDFGGISNLGCDKKSANSIVSEYTEVGRTIGRVGRGQGGIVGEMWKVEEAAYGPVGSKVELLLCLHIHQKRHREHKEAGKIKD